jgi:hypothetical protein
MDNQDPAKKARATADKKQQYDFHKRFLRKPVEIRVEVERFQEGLASSSVNMSPSGICFDVGEQLEENERFKVLLYIPRGKEVEILKVEGRMIWQDHLDNGLFRTGAAFEKFAPGDERRIRQWLLELGRDEKKPSR